MTEPTPAGGDAGGSDSIVDAVRAAVGDLVPDVGRRELLAVLLMALTSILTAWTAFQSSKWGGEMTTFLSQGTAARTESVRQSDLGSQQFTTDNLLFSNWLNAEAAGDTELADFYIDRFPDELHEAFLVWVDLEPLDDPDAPASPFETDEYVLESDIEAETLRERADDLAVEAAEANQTGDDYTLTTVIYAVVLLLAALSTKVRQARTETLLLGFAAAVFVGTTIVILTFPVAI